MWWWHFNPEVLKMVCAMRRGQWGNMECISSSPLGAHLNEQLHALEHLARGQLKACAAHIQSSLSAYTTRRSKKPSSQRRTELTDMWRDQHGACLIFPTLLPASNKICSLMVCFLPQKQRRSLEQRGAWPHQQLWSCNLVNGRALKGIRETA